MRLRLLLATLALTIIPSLLTGGCATSGVNSGDLNIVSLDEEWQLGRQLSADIAQQMTLVNDPQALAYLDKMGRAIVAQTEMRNLPWEFHIVKDPAINAFNIPGGHVYVNTGLVASASNSAELAGVLAHEITHGVSRHATERISKQYGLSMGAGVLLGQNPAVYEQLLTSIIGGGAMAKFSRDDEREADRLGIRYMNAAGYDPAAMATMFEKLQAEGQRRPSGLEQFFSTHPLTQERINDARAYARKVSSRGVRLNDAGYAGFRQRLARY